MKKLVAILFIICLASFLGAMAIDRYFSPTMFKKGVHNLYSYNEDGELMVADGFELWLIEDESTNERYIIPMTLADKGQIRWKKAYSDIKGTHYESEK